MKHINVIKLHEIFEGENTYYFIYDYLEGDTLNDFLKKSIYQPLGKRDIKKIIKVI